MKFERATLDTCENATDIVVVIDVLRAFSTAAYAFNLGAHSITLVGAVDEALALKRRNPSVLLMGEVEGLAIEGFDFGNSPTELLTHSLHGRQLVQRTSAGTQGIVRSRNARVTLAASLCCAAATARYLRPFPDRTVTFVSTGKKPGGWGDEDDACADYIESLLKGETPDMETYAQRVRVSQTAQKFSAPDGFVFPASDVDHCVAVDKFDFAMLVERQDGLAVMRPVLL
ncbi:MAG: 2-phosphosulfolactate phosphatase [Anaerolineales bacterium]|nr:2-phosphosulfolactate phosphatase [Anaerolineales bacterium]